jgi:hypothetical protein
MDITVFVESCEGNGYRATSFSPLRLVAQAPTRDEALEQLSQLVRTQIGQGELVQLHIPLPGEAHPWLALAGTWKDHPEAAEFEQDMLEYRRQVDADPDRL